MDEVCQHSFVFVTSRNFGSMRMCKKCLACSQPKVPMKERQELLLAVAVITEDIELANKMCEALGLEPKDDCGGL